MVSGSEFRSNLKKYFELSESQRVLVKRNDKVYEIVSQGDYVDDGISPSKDPYFDDDRNMQDVVAGIRQLKEEKTVAMREGEALTVFLNRVALVRIIRR